MNHLSSQITTIGRGIVLDYMKHHGTPLDENDITIVNGVKCLVVISVKRHKLIFKEKVKATGINAGRLLKIKEKAEKHNCPLIYLMFVDAQLGCCYAGYYNELMVPTEFEGVTFPTQIPGPSGLVTYFSIYHLKTLFKLSPSIIEKLKQLIIDNKSDKNQLNLF